MANLTRQQVAEYIAAKRRRDRGDPYMETRIALTDADRLGIYGLLDGQPLPGATIVEGFDRPGQLGAYASGPRNLNRGQFYRYLVGRSKDDPLRSRFYERPPRMPTSVAQASRSWFPRPQVGSEEIKIKDRDRFNLSNRSLQDDLAHEVGHRAHSISGLLGTRSGLPQSGIDPYTERERLNTAKKSDRWHNVLYGDDANVTWNPRTERWDKRARMRKRSGEFVDVNQTKGYMDSLIAEELARKIMQQQERERIRRYMQGAVDL